MLIVIYSASNQDSSETDFVVAYEEYEGEADRDMEGNGAEPHYRTEHEKEDEAEQREMAKSGVDGHVDQAEQSEIAQSGVDGHVDQAEQRETVRDEELPPVVYERHSQNQTGGKGLPTKVAKNPRGDNSTVPGGGRKKTNQKNVLPAHKATGGKAPRKKLAGKAARKVPKRTPLAPSTTKKRRFKPGSK